MGRTRRFNLLALISWLTPLALGGCGGSEGGGEVPAEGAWAVRIASADQLLHGRTAKGKIGDYKIFNDRVAFVIHDVGRVTMYKQYGGQVADADVIGADGQALGASQLGDLFFGFNQRLFEPDQVELVAAADNDGRALVRVTGRDAFFDWLGAYLANVLPMGTIESDLVLEYSLGPGDQALRIDVTVTNQGRDPLILDMPEFATINGDGLEPYFAGPGFAKDEQVGEYPWWIGRGQRVSYGLLAEEGPIKMVLNISNVAFGIFPKAEIRPGRSAHFVRWLVAVDGGVNQVQRLLADLAGRPLGAEVAGQVDAAQEAFERGVRVHVLDAEGLHASQAPVAGDGSFELHLAPGDYQLIAKADGFDASEALPIEAVEGQRVEADLVIPPATPVAYRVTDDHGDLLPARLTVLRSDDVSTNILAPEFGEETYGYGGAARVVWAGTGEGELLLPDGTYEVVVSKGYEYEVARVPLVLAGEPQIIDEALARVVDSSGYLSGDFHIHGQFSPDSSVDPDLRVRTALSEGVELLVMTEHDFIKDFGQAVADLQGAADRIQAVIGSEITTYMYGHFNAWPLTEKPDQIANGGIEWFDTPAPALFDRIRASENQPVVLQVNHPRAAAVGGYFSAIGLDVAKGTYERDDWWSPDFDSIEVFNGGCGNGNRQEVLDWFAFLDRGYRVSVGGGSDSHYQYHTLGTPRVYVPTQHGPADFDPQELVPAFIGQRVFVSCGPFVRLTIDGHGLGELVDAAGPVTASVEVQAPAWMDFEQLRLVGNAGQVLWSLPAEQWTPGAGGLRHQGTVELDPPADTWVVLEVTGRGSNPPVSSQNPYALTNPIYLDVDGNGAFDAPLGPFTQEP